MPRQARTPPSARLLLSLAALLASLLVFAAPASASPPPPLVTATITATAVLTNTSAGVELDVNGTVNVPDVALAGQTVLLTVNHVVICAAVLGADGVFHVKRLVSHAVALALRTVGLTLEFAGGTLERTLDGVDGLLCLLGVIPRDVIVAPVSTTVFVVVDAVAIL